MENVITLGHDYLSATEKEKLKAFAEDKTLINAVKKVLLSSKYSQGVLEPDKLSSKVNFAIQEATYALQNNPAINDEDLGRNLRANVAGIRLIELGFQELEKFKPASVSKDDKNPAR